MLQRSVTSSLFYVEEDPCLLVFVHLLSLRLSPPDFNWVSVGYTTYTVSLLFTLCKRSNTWHIVYYYREISVAKNVRSIFRLQGDQVLIDKLR